MRSIIYSAWVKNVYRQSNNQFTNSDVSSPTPLTYNLNQPSLSEQLPVYRLIVTKFADQFSTIKINYLYLLNSLYTPNPQALLLRALKRI